MTAQNICSAGAISGALPEKPEATCCLSVKWNDGRVGHVAFLQSPASDLLSIQDCGRPTGTRQAEDREVCMCEGVFWHTRTPHLSSIQYQTQTPLKHTHCLQQLSSLLCPPHRHRCCSGCEVSKVSVSLSIITTHIQMGKNHTHTLTHGHWSTASEDPAAAGMCGLAHSDLHAVGQA